MIYLAADHGGFNLKEEIKRFKDAVKKAKDELYRIIEQTPKDFSQHAHILETHMVLFKDKMLYGRTIETIENEQVNAEWALKTVVSNVKAMFMITLSLTFRKRPKRVQF